MKHPAAGNLPGGVDIARRLLAQNAAQSLRNSDEKTPMRSGPLASAYAAKAPKSSANPIGQHINVARQQQAHQQAQRMSGAGSYHGAQPQEAQQGFGNLIGYDGAGNAMYDHTPWNPGTTAARSGAAAEQQSVQPHVINIDPSKSNAENFDAGVQPTGSAGLLGSLKGRISDQEMQMLQSYASQPGVKPENLMSAVNDSLSRAGTQSRFETEQQGKNLPDYGKQTNALTSAREKLLTLQSQYGGVMGDPNTDGQWLDSSGKSEPQGAEMHKNALAQAQELQKEIDYNPQTPYQNEPAGWHAGMMPGVTPEAIAGDVANKQQGQAAPSVQQQAPQPAAQAQQQSGPPKVATAEDYAAIKPGMNYMTPDGHIRLKPQVQTQQVPNAQPVGQ